MPTCFLNRGFPSTILDSTLDKSITQGQFEIKEEEKLEHLMIIKMVKSPGLDGIRKW